MKYFILLLFISLNAFGMQVKILCERKDGNVGCKMAYQYSNFLTVNNGSVYFNHGKRCFEESCDWIGLVDPTILFEGTNHADFAVTSLTSNPNAYAKHKYSFYFGGKSKGSFVSTRRGTEVDQTSISFELDLKEIDPALYNEYIGLNKEYEASLGKELNPKRKNDDLAKETPELRKKMQELIDLANSIKNKQFDEIDAETLAKLGIVENQIKLLTARKEELIQYATQTERTREQVQTQILARYEAVRVRARTYDSNLPDLPISPEIKDPSQHKISSLVEELNNELMSVLSRVEGAISAKNFKDYSDALKDWKRVSDHTVSLYTESSDINDAEKALLYHTVYQGTSSIFKDGVSNDSWRKTNSVSVETRQAIDELAEQGMAEAKNLRDTLNFKKIPSELSMATRDSLTKVTTLANRLKVYDAQTETQKQAKTVAKASLEVGLNSINNAIEQNSKASLEEADQSSGIGLMLLDIGIDFIPVVGSVRSAIELFMGKNLVTGETYTKLDYSMAFIGVFSGLVGFNGAKLALQPATELISKIGRKIGLPWARTAKEVSENLPQMDTLIASYKKLKKPFFQFQSSELINATLKMKYARFTKPAFMGSVITRATESGEEFCRIISKKKDRALQIFSADGGIFVFRCSDIVKKTISEIMEMGAIPHSNDLEKIFIAKIIPPFKTSTIEGIAAPMDGKAGGAIQIFLDIVDSVSLDKIRQTTVIREITHVFDGF